MAKAKGKSATATTATGSRTVRYGVAMSLDGYIAGPSGEFDWIVMDPEIDFKAMFARYDTFIMGRKTFEVVGTDMMRGNNVYVVSRTFRPKPDSPVTVIADGVDRLVKDLKAKPGKDIWLFGGGELFRSMLSDGLVDEVEVAIIPVLLGRGIPFLRAPAPQVSLELTGHRLFSKTGTVLLEYRVRRG